MGALLVCAGFRLRGRNRADCAYCEGHSRGTVSYTDEVALSAIAVIGAPTCACWPAIWASILPRIASRPPAAAVVAQPLGCTRQPSRTDCARQVRGTECAKDRGAHRLKPVLPEARETLDAAA